MACKVPLVTTAIGTRDFAIHNKTAIVYEELEDLIKGILFFKRDRKKGKKLVEAGYKKIQEFSWKKYTNIWETFLKDHLSPSKSIFLNLSSETIESLGIETREAIFPSKPAKTQSIVQVSREKSNDKNRALCDAIKSKSLELRKQYNLTGTQEIKFFDKYDILGAYHWNERDIVYSNYVYQLKLIFQAIKDFYGPWPILDVGGGDGFIASELCDMEFPVHLIEINETAIHLATEQLKGKPVEISNTDFFTMLPTEIPPIVLLSQVIEHFEHPEILIAKLVTLQPDIIIVTTPIQKEGEMWDSAYHYHEFSESELIGLFQPLSEMYMISYQAQLPYNQYLTLEKKSVALTHYLNHMNALGSYSIEEEVIKAIVETCLSIASCEVKRS